MSEQEQDEPITEEQVADANELEPDAIPDDQPEDEDEPDAEPDEAPEGEPDSLAVMEEIGKKLDSLQKTVATRISTILGEHANDFEVCDLCSYWNTPGWRMKGHLPQDLTAQLLHVLNQRAPSDLKPDPHSTICDECDGEGSVQTPSKVEGQIVLPCVRCNARGWLPTDAARGGADASRANGPTYSGDTLPPVDAAMNPAAPSDTPEIRALRAQGYVIVPPITMTAG